MPILLITRGIKLGRQPCATDFTLEERAKLRRSLTHCIRSADECGDIDMAESLRGHWTCCIRLGEPPRFDVIPELQERRNRVVAVIKLASLGVEPIYLFPEDDATD